MIFSNVHLAYGDDSVYQMLVVNDVNEFIEDGNSFSEWKDCGTKLRAVKCDLKSYIAIVRDSSGSVLYEGRTEYEFPSDALKEALDWYTSNVTV